jgi:hypothetical protein
VEVRGSNPYLDTLDIISILAIVIFFFNYIGILLVSPTTERGGFMDRLIQNVKNLLASVVNGASAICSSVLASWLAVRNGPEILGFHLSSFMTTSL